LDALKAAEELSGVPVAGRMAVQHVGWGCDRASLH
jgi:hypothetical protein